ncbi:hypothetical protein AB6A40_010129 [Gnathostoma spinigerum]|uniref:Uncharacterized protein n=1 Tax=Gnathostoma spinigerum TaxID=75299 RepID=A0ABD6ETW9_9BILA
MKLCSLAVQFPRPLLLVYVSQWLSQIGSGKTYAQKLISVLVDYFLFSTPECNLHAYLMPLDDDAREFVAYFIDYSITDYNFRPQHITVLQRWLTDDHCDSLLSIMKEVPTMARQFAESAFGNLVLYDIISGGRKQNQLHGVTVMLYSDWGRQPPFRLFPAFQILVSSDFSANMDIPTLAYHIHIATLAGFWSTHDLLNYFPLIIKVQLQ